LKTKIKIVWDAHRMPKSWTDALGTHTNPCGCKDIRTRCPHTFAETFEVESGQPGPFFLVFRLGTHILQYPLMHILALDVEDAESAEMWRKAEEVGIAGAHEGLEEERQAVERVRTQKRRPGPDTG
jgi:hypothetical protein